MTERKLPCYRFSGIHKLFPLELARNHSLPTTVHFHQVRSGLHFLFKKEKMYRISVGFRDYIFLAKAEAVEEYFTSNVPTTKAFENVLRPFFGNGLFLSTGEKWKSRRATLKAMLHYDIMKRFIPVLDKESGLLVDVLMNKLNEGGIDIRHATSLCVLNMVFATFFGTNIAAQRNEDCHVLKTMERVLETMIKRILNPLYQLDKIFMLTSLGKQFREDIRYLRCYAMEAFQEAKKRQSQQDELNKQPGTRNCTVEMYLGFKRSDPKLTDEDMRDEVLSLIFAAADTTATSTTWGLYLIGLYPEVQSKIHEELDAVFGEDKSRPITLEDIKQLRYIECVLKESQRLYPSIPVIPRILAEDVVLCGYKLRKGTYLSVDVYNLHHDPEVFCNPDIFDPDRFLSVNSFGRSSYAYIPFSAGVRSCVGRHLATMNMKIIVANVLRNFTLKSLVHRDKVCESVDLLLRPSQPLRVEFIPRKGT